ncbi:hypothetical protein U1Q18_051589 [Sarracenia purpurea var. burkii]
MFVCLASPSPPWPPNPYWPSRRSAAAATAGSRSAARRNASYSAPACPPNLYWPSWGSGPPPADLAAHRSLETSAESSIEEKRLVLSPPLSTKLVLAKLGVRPTPGRLGCAPVSGNFRGKFHRGETPRTQPSPVQQTCTGQAGGRDPPPGVGEQNFSPSHIFGFPSDLRVSGFHPDSGAAGRVFHGSAHIQEANHTKLVGLSSRSVLAKPGVRPTPGLGDARFFAEPYFRVSQRSGGFWISPRQPRSWRAAPLARFSRVGSHPRGKPRQAHHPVQQICTGQDGGPTHPRPPRRAKFFAEPYFPVSQRSEGFWISPRQPRGWPDFVRRLTIKWSATLSSPPCPVRFVLVNRATGGVLTLRLSIKRSVAPTSLTCPPDPYWSSWGSDPPPATQNFSPSHIFALPSDLTVSGFHPDSRATGGVFTGRLTSNRQAMPSSPTCPADLYWSSRGPTHPRRRKIFAEPYFRVSQRSEGFCIKPRQLLGCRGFHAATHHQAVCHAKPATLSSKLVLAKMGVRPTLGASVRKNFSPSHIFPFPDDLRVSGFHPDSRATGGFPWSAHIQQASHAELTACPADLYWSSRGVRPTPTTSATQNFSPSHIFAFPSDLTVSGFRPDSCAAGKVFMVQLAIKWSATLSSPPCPANLYWSRWGVGPTPAAKNFLPRPKIPFPSDLAVSGFHPDSRSAGKVFMGRLTPKSQATPSSPPCPADLYWSSRGVRPTPAPKNFSPSHIFRVS